MSSEEKNDIPGYPGYSATRDGRIFSHIRVCEQSQLKSGDYMRVKVTIDKKGLLRMVHVLVALTYLGPCPPGCTVDHINRNALDNNAANLRWATRKEQMGNRRRYGMKINEVVHTLENGQSTTFLSVKDACTRLGVTREMNIYDAIKSKTSFLGGCWSYLKTPAPTAIFKTIPPEALHGLSGCQAGSDGSILNPRGRNMVGSISRAGYMIVGLNGRTYSAHVLIASAFREEVAHPILGVSDELVVNHLDGVKTNNAVSNLQMATRSENTIHAYESGLIPHPTKRVRLLETGEVYSSASEAASSVGGKLQTIRGCVTGHIKSAYGRHWEYVD